MNKNFIKNYKRKLMATHLLVSIVLFIITIVLYLMTLTVLNGFIVDIIEIILGYTVARIIMTNRNIIFWLGVVFILLVGWIVVEWRAVGKLANVISQMDVVFKKDNSKLSLNNEFKEIENELNSLKFENMRNEQLAQMEAQRKTDLITYLAHDIKTPLASVIGYLSLLDEAPDMPLDQKAKYTKITLNKAYRLEDLINEFFDITRFNLSVIPLEKEDINLSFMLAQMIDEFYPMLSLGGRKAVLNVDKDISVYGDGDKLARVFNNILKNAIAYSYENSEIEISAHANKENISIQFLNRGKIIPSHKLETIFDKFFRLDRARSSSTGGAGLGLAIAKGIMVQHGGDIQVTSNETATVFTVILPQKEQVKTKTKVS
ncbi:UNVERIFIED_CONTAM: two-component system sensor histidine kinase VanS [Acetivibrio alkalicellulosi]